VRVLVLGAGKMVDAILTGLRKSENLSEWMIYSPSGSSASKLAGKVGARAVADLTGVKNPEWILVGCKPQQLKELKATLGDRFRESLFVSILAALTEADQLRILEAKDLIRVMPNLPVEHNDGVVLLSSASSKGRLSSFQTLFGKLGQALVVEEAELDELTLLTGSGPAFFYEFARELAASFTALSAEEREKLVRQVLKGSSRSLGGKETLEEMVNGVTSKGGVTIAVLEEWRGKRMPELLAEGIEGGRRRARELRDLLRS
jgi:pyrroline-5-carboxylate reductase